MTILFPDCTPCYIVKAGLKTELIRRVWILDLHKVRFAFLFVLTPSANCGFQFIKIEVLHLGVRVRGSLRIVRTSIKEILPHRAATLSAKINL